MTCVPYLILGAYINTRFPRQVVRIVQQKDILTSYFYYIRENAAHVILNTYGVYLSPSHLRLQRQ